MRPRESKPAQPMAGHSPPSRSSNDSTGPTPTRSGSTRAVSATPNSLTSTPQQTKHAETPRPSRCARSKPPRHICRSVLIAEHLGGCVTMVCVDDQLDAATYESLTGVSKSDYERRLRDEVALCELG